MESYNMDYFGESNKYKILILYINNNNKYPFVKCLYPFYELEYDTDKGIYKAALEKTGFDENELTYSGFDGNNIIFYSNSDNREYLYGYEIIHERHLLDYAKYFLIKNENKYYEMPSVGYLEKNDESIYNEYYIIHSSSKNGEKIAFFTGYNKVVLEDEKINHNWYLKYDSIFIVKLQQYYFIDSSFFIDIFK
jgi:hypothetical protein